MNIALPPQINNRNSGGFPAVMMTADDARKFSVIFTHFPVVIVPVAVDRDDQEVCHAAKV